jgi:hypothetical protein
MSDPPSPSPRFYDPEYVQTCAECGVIFDKGRTAVCPLCKLSGMVR